MEALIKFLRNQFRVGYFNVKLLNPKDVSDPIVGAIKSIPDAATIKNPEEISSGIIEAQKETTQAVKDITFPEQKELDLKPLYEKFDELKTAIDKKELSVTVGETKIDVDTKGIISSVERLQQAVEGSKDTIEPQEVIDYTELLGEVIKNLEKPGYDYSKIEELLDIISKKEVVLPLDEKGRVKVSVDKVSMGGRGSLSSTESAKLLTLATEEKQDAIIASQNLGELAPLLRSILQYLAYPGVLDKPNNATRIIPIGGTVTTVTGLTNIDGYQGKLVAINQNMSAWALSVRSRIS